VATLSRKGKEITENFAVPLTIGTAIYGKRLLISLWSKRIWKLEVGMRDNCGNWRKGRNEETQPRINRSKGAWNSRGCELDTILSG
jgi:hypothetical protein